jgi:hypothetical protein
MKLCNTAQRSVKHGPRLIIVSSVVLSSFEILLQDPREVGLMERPLADASACLRVIKCCYHLSVGRLDYFPQRTGTHSSAVTE